MAKGESGGEKRTRARKVSAAQALAAEIMATASVVQETPTTTEDVTITRNGVTVDLTEVALVIADLERKHGLADRGFHPTREFMIDMAAQLEPLGFGTLSATDAYTIWHETHTKFVDVQKKTQSTRS